MIHLDAMLRLLHQKRDTHSHDLVSQFLVRRIELYVTPYPTGDNCLGSFGYI